MVGQFLLSDRHPSSQDLLIDAEVGGHLGDGLPRRDGESAASVRCPAVQESLSAMTEHSFLFGAETIIAAQRHSSKSSVLGYNTVQMDEEDPALLLMSPERPLVVTLPRANAKRTAASHVLPARSI